MTDKEKAIVMAHTGICMLAGNKFQIFHKYVEDIMNRPIMTHEIGLLADEIKEKSKADFMALCANENNVEEEQESILDKIRAEIEQTVSRYSISRERGGMGQVEWSDFLIKESEVLKILDKYKADSEGEEMKISEIITDKYKLRIPPTVYYDLLADVQEAEEEQEPKTGHWIDDKCSVCGKGTENLIASPKWYRDEEPNFCPFCGIRLVNSQSKSEEV